MSKHTIISCDLCNGRIYRNGAFLKHMDGAVSIRAKMLKRVISGADELGALLTYPAWKRNKYHICPACINKIKELCRQEGNKHE